MVRTLTVCCGSAGGTVALSRFGRKCAKSAIDIARVFCAGLADFSPMQQSPANFHPVLCARQREVKKSNLPLYLRCFRAVHFFDVRAPLREVATSRHEGWGWSTVTMPEALEMGCSLAG
jgi:hypothetical protein